MPKRKHSPRTEQQGVGFPVEQEQEPPQKKLLDSLTYRWASFGRTSSDLWDWAVYTAQWPGDDGVWYSPSRWYWWWTWNRWTTAESWSDWYRGRGS